MPTGALIMLTDSNQLHRRRNDDTNTSGNNTYWSSQSQGDLLRVDRYGNIDPDTPIVLDFNDVTGITAIPVEDEKVTIFGGTFDRRIRTPNPAPDGSQRFYRGIRVSRSNVVISNIAHTSSTSISSNDQALYGGMIVMNNVSDIVVQNVQFLGHFEQTGGNYDMGMYSVANVSFINVWLQRSITNSNVWGWMGSQDAKNILFDNVRVNRIGIHRGAHNLTVRN
jgi:hypothetical protein